MPTQKCLGGLGQCWPINRCWLMIYHRGLWSMGHTHLVIVQSLLPQITSLPAYDHMRKRLSSTDASAISFLSRFLSRSFIGPDFPITNILEEIGTVELFKGTELDKHPCQSVDA